MVIGGSDASTDRVGQPQLGANLLEETAAKAATENLVHDGDGGHIGIMAVSSQTDNLDIRLVHVFFVDEVDAGLWPGEDIVARGKSLRLGKTFKRGAHFGFHGGGIEVTTDADY